MTEALFESPLNQKISQEIEEQDKAKTRCKATYQHDLEDDKPLILNFFLHSVTVYSV